MDKVANINIQNINKQINKVSLNADKNKDITVIGYGNLGDNNNG